MTNDILFLIQDKLSSCSKGKKRIAQYILDHYDQAAFMTAGAIGKAVQVSESTVVRFAGELGFHGYPEMQKALQDMVKNHLTNAQRIEVGEKRLEQEDLLSSVLQQDLECLRETLRTMDREVFREAIRSILNAKRIYVLGVRSSAPLAAYFAYYLHLIFEDVHLVQGSSDSDILQQLVRISSSDVLFAISFPRYSSAVSQAMGYAGEAGAKTIALTDHSHSPLADHADLLLIGKCELVSVAASMVAPMSILHALIAALSLERKQHTEALFHKLEQIWDRYHVYEKIVD